MKLTDFTATQREDLETRLWAKIQIRDVEECWPWRGAKASDCGHGVIKVPRTRRNMLAHRIVFELFFGPLENEACHHCDNPPCCNPFHLFDGTQAENVADMKAKCRTKAKLGAQQLIAIKLLLALGQRQYLVARQFNVHRSTILTITRGEYSCSGQAV